jgi:hypothetical protein
LIPLPYRASPLKRGTFILAPLFKGGWGDQTSKKSFKGFLSRTHV